MGLWMILGAGAIVLTVLNLAVAWQGKEPKLFRFFSLSLTALTVCAFYSDEAERVTAQDWKGLLDIMPTMSKILWIFVIVSIGLNAITLFKKK